MISFKVTDGSGIHLQAEGPGLLSEKLMWAIGQAVRATTVRLTSSGRDFRGKPFAKYSTNRMYVSPKHKPKPKGGRRKTRSGRPMKYTAYDGGYLEYRKAHGRSGKPDLQFTGNMLANFQIVQLRHNLVRLGFPSKTEQAKALGNITGLRGRSSRRINPRPFIGIGPDHERSIHAAVEDHLDEIGYISPKGRRIQKIA